MSNINTTANVTHPYGVDITRKVYSVFLIFIFLLGVFGNALTIIVLRTKNLRLSSTATYLTALAIVDMLYLMTSLLVNIVNSAFLFPRDLRNSHPIACYLMPFFNYTFSYLSVWLMVAVTVDRAIWVTQPFRAKLLCTQRNAIITIVFLTTALVSLDSHFFWTMTYVQVKRFEEDESCKPNHFSKHIFPYIDFLLVCCVPFLFMLAANVFIGWQLKKMRDFTRRRQPSKSQSRRNSNFELRPPVSAFRESSTQIGVCGDSSTADYWNQSKRKTQRQEKKDSIKVRSNVEKSYSLTTMLFAVSIFFMISVSPLMVYDIIYYAINLSDWLEANGTWATTLVFAVERIVYTIWYTNFAAHFFLYCLNGPPFRAKALSLFRCCGRTLRVNDGSNGQQRLEVDAKVDASTGFPKQEVPNRSKKMIFYKEPFRRKGSHGADLTPSTNQISPTGTLPITVPVIEISEYISEAQIVCTDI